MVQELRGLTPMPLTLALSHGYRTSGGGSHVNSGLLAGLQSNARCRVVPFDPQEEAPPRCDVVVCTGTTATRAPGAKTVLWPLNVAPLERETVKIAASGLRSRARYALLPLKLRRSIRQCDGLVFGSQYAADLYRAEIPRAADLPYAVVRTGMPSLDRDEVGETAPEPGRVLMVSHLYPYKLVVEAIEAMARVRREHPDAQLRIAGKAADDRYAPRVRQALEEHPGAAVLLGSLAPEELLEEYARAQVALLTSASENAGSFHLFDSAAFGLPIVASRLSSTPSVMGDAALYVDPHDPADIARGVDVVLGDAARRRELQDASTRFAERAPTWPERADDLVTFCEELTS